MDERSVSMLPRAHQVEAALWVIGLLRTPRIPVADARAAYAASVSGGLYAEDDMLAAEELLMSAGLLSVEDDELVIAPDAMTVHSLDAVNAACAMTVRLLERDPPLWLRAAAGGAEVRAELIPDGDRDALDRMLGDAGFERDPVLRTVVRRWEQQHLAAMTAAGSTLVAQCCRDELASAGEIARASEVRRFDEVVPALGCNVVAPAIGGGLRRLLVRTTRRLSWRVPVVLTREQLAAGQADSSWALVVCEAAEDGSIGLAGWCRADALAAMLPTEPHPHGRWAVISVQLVEELLTPGLPGR
jgi:hypothetical protein